MAIRTLTLHEVPKEVRAVGAANARRQIQLLLRNPHLTPVQRMELQEQLKWAGKWESLDIGNLVPSKSKANPNPSKNEAQRKPQHHTVEVVESLSVDED